MTDTPRGGERSAKRSTNEWAAQCLRALSESGDIVLRQRTGLRTTMQILARCQNLLERVQKLMRQGQTTERDGAEVRREVDTEVGRDRVEPLGLLRADAKPSHLLELGSVLLATESVQFAEEPSLTLSVQLVTGFRVAKVTHRLYLLVVS